MLCEEDSGYKKAHCILSVVSSEPTHAAGLQLTQVAVPVTKGLPARNEISDGRTMTLKNAPSDPTKGEDSNLKRRFGPLTR